MLVQLTDCHVVAGPAGDAAAAALAQVVSAVGELPVDPAAVLLSGDLTDDGAPESYARVRELLSPLRAPVYAIPGNHDDPANLRAVFGEETEADVGGLRLLLCDTHVPGTDAGSLDVADLAARLDGRDTIVAMHHPPLQTGIRLFDDIVLPREQRDALAALLAANPQVRRVVCGHVHRVIFETLGGCGIFTAPATWQQIEPGPTRGSFAFVDRGRGYAIHSVLDGVLLSQVQPV